MYKILKKTMNLCLRTRMDKMMFTDRSQTETDRQTWQTDGQGWNQYIPKDFRWHNVLIVRRVVTPWKKWIKMLKMNIYTKFILLLQIFTKFCKPYKFSRNSVKRVQSGCAEINQRMTDFLWNSLYADISLNSM